MAIQMRVICGVRKFLLGAQAAWSCRGSLGAHHQRRDENGGYAQAHVYCGEMGMDFKWSVCVCGRVKRLPF